MLNLAAAVLEPRALRILVASLFCSIGLTGAASALEGIDLSAPPEASAEGECPRLIQIKYPFLACANGQIGQSDADETWDAYRYIQRGSHFVEGTGYYGDDLNRN